MNFRLNNHNNNNNKSNNITEESGEGVEYFSKLEENFGLENA